MNERLNERSKLEKYKGLKKTSESSVLRGFNVCLVDRPTNRPTDRHDLLSLNEDTSKSNRLCDNWANCSILSQVQ